MIRPDILKLAKQLWQSKERTSDTGFVTYRPEGNRALADLQHAWREVRELLIVRMDAIGDTFLFLDSLRKLRELFPKAQITVAAYAENKQIYERCPFVDQGFFIDRQIFATDKLRRAEWLKKLQERDQPWEVLLNPLFSREPYSEELVKLTPARIKLGVGGDHSNIAPKLAEATGAYYTCLLPVEAAVVRHELHRHNEILSLLGSRDPAVACAAPLTEEDRSFAAKLAENFELKRFGVIFPGVKGGTGALKYWGSDNYASLLDQLKAEGGCELVLMGGPGADEEQIESEITALTQTRPLVFRGDLSLWQAAALLERAAFYIGSDTSMAHISTALKVPSFVLLGGGHFGRFFPYPAGGTSHSLYHKLACFDCYWQCRLSYNKCIADISVTEVMAALQENLPPPAADPAPARAPSFTLHPLRPSLPRIDLVLPGGMQTWHLKESWALILERAGSLHRVFRPTPETAGPLLDYLRQGGEADLLLALGGDHHLGFLHDNEEKREAWRAYRAPRVCNSFESTRDSLYKRYVGCVTTALSAYSHFAYTDEVDAAIFEAAKVPALWWPQAADQRLFSSQRDPAQRQARIFFCGKTWNEYVLRRTLLQALRTTGVCEIVERASAGEMVSHYNRNLLAINLPGVLGAFNVRTYEALSCGCALLQFAPENRPANNALFQHGTHLLYYDYSSIEKLKDWVRQVAGSSAAVLTLARQGHEEFLAHHTIERRLEQLIDWVCDGRQPAYPQYGEISAEARQKALQRRYVNDRYLFEKRPCWNPRALNDFADLQFVNHRGIVQRVCQEGELLVHQHRPVEAMRVFKQAVERDTDLPLAHNNLGVLAWRRGERQRALRHFAVALAEDPSYRPAVINYAEVLSLTGAAAEAARVYADFLQREPGDAGVRALAEFGAEAVAAAIS
jgi:ADP-heptose:LPS heptosyltransferase/tetratricopeptide (TPR) repeat protein